jgi:hypothetical protein
MGRREAYDGAGERKEETPERTGGKNQRVRKRMVNNQKDLDQTRRM